MTRKIWIAIIGTVVIAMVILAMKAKKWYSEVKYGVADGVKLLKISIAGAEIFLPSWIYNPTPFSMVLSNLNVEVYFNQKFVSRIQSPNAIKIRANSNSIYPMIVNVGSQDLLNFLSTEKLDLNDKDWLKKVQVQTIGTATLDFGIFRFKNFPINYVDNLKSYVG